MPIYEYRCSDCGHKLETLQRLADAPLVTCPACGKDALSKLVTAAGFQLKGSGWYATDFRSSGSKPADKATTEGGGEAKVTAESGGDGKPAAATPSSAESKPASKPESKSETKSDAKAAATSATPAGSGSGSA
jgi:putative FmdB family regulatory protein